MQRLDLLPDYKKLYVTCVMCYKAAPFHREYLVSQSLPSEMDCAMKNVIIVVNSIKGKAVQTRL